MESITINSIISAPIEKVWDCFTSPEHITKWNTASEDWHTPCATNDLKTGGKFSSRMEAKDGSAGFDFEGTYDEVVALKLIRYTMEDGRKVSVSFSEGEDGVHISETFDPETENTIELQRSGWQSILDNFKRYVEG